MNNIGKIDVFYMQTKYHIGFDYAQNVINKLVNIGYIKKTDTIYYLLLQTESTIDTYVRTHLDELRPDKYIEYDIKDNGKRSLKSKVDINLSYYALIIPVFIRRLLFSIPGTILYLFIIFLLRHSEVDGHPLTIAQYIYICIFFYIIIGIPINIITRIIECTIFKIKFKDLMLQPKNWFFLRIKKIYEISRLLYPEKKLVIPNSYESTINKLKTILKEKKALADHYANIANTTTDENEFYTAIGSCKETLEWMSQFEKYDVFINENKPSDDIKSINDGMQSSVEALHNRVANRISKPVEQQTKNDISILEKVDYMEGHNFEYFCADLLTQNHFSNVEVTRGSGDQGVDIIATRDGIKYAIQCKCYSQNIGNKAVQEVFAGKTFYNCHVAAVLTNQYFTSSAQALAESNGVLLWDRDKLEEMITNMN